VVEFDAPKLQFAGFFALTFVTGEGVGAGILLIFRGLGVAFGKTPLLASVVAGWMRVIDTTNDTITVATIVKFSFFICFLFYCFLILFLRVFAGRVPELPELVVP
jgi:hypothetical protein